MDFNALVLRQVIRTKILKIKKSLLNAKGFVALENSKDDNLEILCKTHEIIKIIFITVC